MDTWQGFFDVVENKPNLNEIENFLKIPLVRQPNGYTCGVGAVLSVLMYYGKEVSYDQLTKELNATDREGVDHRDIIKFFKSLGYDVELRKGMLISELYDLIDEGTPIIVCFQAWAKDPKVESEGWEHGHYAVVCGYDADNLYFMDPSTLGTYTYIPIDEFSARWHDQDMEIKLRQSGIIVRGTPKYDPEKITKLM